MNLDQHYLVQKDRKRKLVEVLGSWVKMQMEELGSAEQLRTITQALVPY